MSEFRKDPIVGRWVVIAVDRARRPQDVARLVPVKSAEVCPFCEGSEALTPPEVVAIRDPQSAANRAGWRVRVVSNKFPALHPEGELNTRCAAIHDMMDGVGAHEVIIECPHHEPSMARLTVENYLDILWVYKNRLLDWKRDPRFVSGLIFKNSGALAGASLEHSHSQLIVTPMVPMALRDELQGALEFYNACGECVFCDINRQESASGCRIVMESQNFIVCCPFASRFPYEIWVLPKNHSSHFENISRPDVEELGMILKSVLAKLELALDDPPYNYVIHTSPFDVPEIPHYHWHLEITPRLVGIAGFELGTGIHINPVPPEDAAMVLREQSLATPSPSERNRVLGDPGFANP
jgi:UDPglucose--hexose-1-phosphate uridylyltransferase